MNSWRSSSKMILFEIFFPYHSKNMWISNEIWCFDFGICFSREHVFIFVTRLRSNCKNTSLFWYVVLSLTKHVNSEWILLFLFVCLFFPKTSFYFFHTSRARRLSLNILFVCLMVFILLFLVPSSASIYKPRSGCPIVRPNRHFVLKQHIL